MAYLNKVMLIGNIGKDPEVRVNPNGGRKRVTFPSPLLVAIVITTPNRRNRPTGITSLAGAKSQISLNSLAFARA